VHALQKIRQQYQGKDVVFIKCIQRRHRGDWNRQLTEYLKYFSSVGETDNIAYVESITTVQSLAREETGMVIYDRQGRVFNPSEVDAAGNRVSYAGEATMRSQLNAVLEGRGRFLDGQDLVKNQKQNWILIDSTGNYYTFLSNEPRSPSADYNDRADSVFQTFVIPGEGVWAEREMLLHFVPQDKGYYRTMSYDPIYGPLSRKLRVAIEGPGNMIVLYDGHRIYRRYKLIHMGRDILVLQLI
jgi:hypothetical protein